MYPGLLYNIMLSPLPWRHAVKVETVNKNGHLDKIAVRRQKNGNKNISADLNRSFFLKWPSNTFDVHFWSLNVAQHDKAGFWNSNSICIALLTTVTRVIQCNKWYTVVTSWHNVIQIMLIWEIYQFTVLYRKEHWRWHNVIFFVV